MNRFTTQKIARFSIIVTISALMMFTLIKSSSHNANAVDQKNGQAISVTALRVQESSLPIRMTFSGPVVGRDEVPIYSELSQGLIDKVLVEAGQHVKAGTVLAMIDASALRIQKTQQQANLQRAGVAIKQQENSLEDAQTQYEQAQIERKRADQVAESGLISKEIREQRVMAEQLARTRVQTMKNNLGMAQADFNLASAQLAETDLHLNQTSIRSPIPGMVVERKVHTGMSLAQNTEPLFNILRDDDLEVELEVSADDATRLKLGMPVTIQLLNDMNEVKANKNGEVEAVLDQVEAWSSAWKTKDINAYLNFYSSDFVSEQKLSKSAWLKQRRNRFASKDILNIELSKINVQVTGDKAIVEFLQNYIANGKKDESNKRLTLSFKDGLWLIVREQTIPHLGNVKLSSSQEKTSQQANIFNGKVCRAATQINRQDQIAKVRVRFDQTPSLILGQFARVAATIISRKGVYLPDTAVRFEGTSAYVFMAKDGVAKRQLVKVGQHIGNKLEILDGVKAGAVVIDMAASFLHDGEPIHETVRSIN